ncbi:hypothetical protein HYW60_01810 [Candidatus Kaiserbacteria bacterium]|nr:hypothetical protein [Candidatus Kaiserbacteria bacterium]
MSWLFAHPYIAAFGGAILVLVIGGTIVVNRSDVNPQTSGIRAWGGVGSNLFDPTNVGVRQLPSTPADNLYTQVLSGPPFYYTTATEQLPLAQPQSEIDFDFDAFVALLSAPPRVAAGDGSTAPPALDAYSFIPLTLISTSTRGEELTPTQQALFNYGNEAGLYIQSFEDMYRSAPQILKDQFEDREDPEKNAVLLSLARALGDVGEQLAEMEVPSEIVSSHQKVAASYRELGAKLSAVPEANTDEAVLNAMLAYNAAVEAYVRNYVSLATLISAYGVSFAPEDAGSIFTFSQVGL